jgi:hypothetical protein
MYKVLKYFTDLHDKNYPYNEGDIFPRKGIKVTEERLAELAGSDNKRGEPLIVKVEEPQAEEKPEPKKPAKKKKAAEK